LVQDSNSLILHILLPKQHKTQAKTAKKNSKKTATKTATKFRHVDSIQTQSYSTIQNVADVAVFLRSS